MLEKIREGSQGVWAMVIIGLVVLSFVFAGVGSYINSPSNSAAASVNGEDISQAALEKAYQSERARMESQFGDAFAALAADANYLKQFRQGILDRLISEKLLDQTAKSMGLRVSDQQIKSTILAMQEFQIGGQFNNDRYLALLRQAGFQPNTFRDYMRVEMTRQQISRALLGSEFSLPSEAAQAYSLQQQTRDLRFLTIPAASFSEQVQISDDEISAYYQANLTQFDTEEKVSVDYVELQVADLLPAIELTEQQLEEYYQQNQADYRSEEERRVSHILIEFADDETAAQVQAEDILAKVQAGEDFAELAKQYSADSFSAENGGDLDWLSKGMMDPAFEESAFSLAAVGDTSGVVKSEFGYHIIKLTGLKAEQVTPFDEVKEAIMASVKKEKAIEEFYELHQQMAAIAFEVPDTLDDVAAIINKPISHTELFGRNSAPAPIDNAVALNSAFSDELIEDRVNSEVIELSDEHILVLRVSAHEPERTKALDEVTAGISEYLTAQKAQEAAKTWAESLLASLNQGEDISPQLQEQNIEWQEQQNVARNAADLDRAITEQLFKLAVSDTQDKAVSELANGDIGLIQLLKVNEAEPADDTILIGLQKRLGNNRSQAIMANFIESLKAQADITITNQ